MEYLIKNISSGIFSFDNLTKLLVERRGVPAEELSEQDFPLLLLDSNLKFEEKIKEKPIILKWLDGTPLSIKYIKKINPNIIFAKRIPLGKKGVENTFTLLIHKDNTDFINKRLVIEGLSSICVKVNEDYFVYDEENLKHESAFEACDKIIAGSHVIDHDLELGSIAFRNFTKCSFSYNNQKPLTFFLAFHKNVMLNDVYDDHFVESYLITAGNFLLAQDNEDKQKHFEMLLDALQKSEIITIALRNRLKYKFYPFNADSKYFDILNSLLMIVR